MKQLSYFHALKTGLSGSLASCIFLILHESHCIWIVISALLICHSNHSSDLSSILTEAIDRFIATGIGVLLGIIGYGMIFFMITENTKELIPLICLMIFVISDLILQSTKAPTVLSISAAIVMLVGIQNHSAIEVSFSRAMDIFIGSCIGIIISLLINPLCYKYSQSKSV